LNLKLLNTEIQRFINNNLNSDISKLLFRSSPFNDVSIKKIVEQIEAKSKSKSKLPTWYATHTIYYPNKLNIEQTSSEVLAAYKSNLISGKSLIDLTGGFGVDCFYFSKQFEIVIHCEIDEKLSNIAKYNFEILKASNIKCINSNGIDFLKRNIKNYDWIFIDPSRRNELKGKVFYLNDCSPNLVKHIDTLLKYSNNIMIKASPMLDVSVGISELKFVKEIHIIAVNNEVKELLYIIKKGYEKKIKLITINKSSKSNQVFQFYIQDESKAQSKYATVKNYLYEPNAAIMKSGAFNLISDSYKLDKLHPNSHLYTSHTRIDFPGRVFKVIKVIPYNKRVTKSELNSKKFNISTRNFPESIQSIKKRYKIKDGGEKYVFFTTDFLNKKLLIFTEKA